MTALGRALAALACAAAAACSAEPAPPPPPARGPLPEGIVARAGAVDVTAASVARIAAAQQIPLARARDLAVRDALFESEARARGLDALPDVRDPIQAVLARRLLRQLLDDADRAGPVTDEELRVTTERHWLDLDRPEGFRTVHAVVRLDPNADAATRDKANAVAEAILAAVAPSRAVALRTESPPPTQRAVDPAADAFQQAAQAVPAQGFQVVVQPLQPVAADGRVLSPDGQTYDARFATAAAALGARGDLSGVVASSFGLHVLMLLERIPARIVPADARRRMVREEVLTDRARAAQARLLAPLRAQPRVSDGVDALLALVRIEP